MIEALATKPTASATGVSPGMRANHRPMRKDQQYGRFVLRSALPYVNLRASLLTWDACCRLVIEGLPWSGIVEVHSIHLARKCAYSRREAEPVSTRNLHRRKLIKYAKCFLVAAKRDGPQLKRELRHVGRTARSGTSERASLPVSTGILPLERDLRWAGGAFLRALCVLRAYRLQQRAADEQDPAQNQRVKTLGYSMHTGTRKTIRFQLKFL